MAKPKRADMYKTNDEFPRWYPWLPQTRVLRRDVDTDPDTGVVSLVHITLSAKKPTGENIVFTADPSEIMYMPRREDGIPRSWSDYPKTMDMCRGDTIPDPKNPSNYYTVISMRAHTPTDADRVVVDLLNFETQDLVRSLGNRFEIFVPGREPYVERISKTERILKSHRGPYRDMSQEKKHILYTFLLHPTGRGRWPSHIEKFKFEADPGEYTTRPPAADEHDVWKYLKFVGHNPDDRHPYDPNVIREQSSKAWTQYKRDHPIPGQ